MEPDRAARLDFSGVDVDIVLFASDMPFESTPGLYVRETIRVIESLDLTSDQKDRAYRKYAERLLSLYCRLILNGPLSV